MKQVLKFVAISFAILAFAACAEESKETPVSFTRKLTFTATREGLSPESKSVRMEDGSTWWNAYEEISVFYGSGSAGGSMFTTQNNTLQDVVEFSGSVQMSGSGKDFWAVYPYSEENECDGSSITTVIPTVQTASEGNFSDDVFPAIAKTKTTEFAFWNICGGIKFFVSRSDIKSVTIKGNNGEALAGKVKVAFDADGKPEVTEVLEGKAEVTLEAPDGGSFKPGKYYYVTLLPTALEGGISLTFFTSSEKGEIVSDNAQIIKRSIFGVLKNVDSKVMEWESTGVEPEYVDLGLSVKWASFNVGATKPEEYGDYFAWGETEPYYSSQNPLTWKDGKSFGYSWASYKWCNGSPSSLTKYNTVSSKGNVDNNTVLDPEDDAAHVNWGGSWRMPTDEEWTELRDNCTWTWTSENGVNGRKVTGPNGNSIFLPAAGYWLDTSFYNEGSYGSFCSSSLCTDMDRTDLARNVYFTSFSVYRDYGSRFSGQSIRPVYGEFIPVSSITLSETSLNLEISSSAQLTATIAPTNATAPSVRWVTGDKSIARVDENGNVSAVAEGTTTVTAYASNGLSVSCQVTVMKPDTGTVPNGHDYVDLGLPSGLKWASMNVGATKPEDYGEYFAWGETEPYYSSQDPLTWKDGKSSGYNWASYKWCNGNSNTQTKYNTNSSFGTVDNKTVLDPEDDAAHVNWGGSWRMPTDAEWTELRTKCTWTWTTNYNGTGVKGRIVTATNGNSIFLPAAGRRFDTLLDYAGFRGDYWSSSLYTGCPEGACYVFFGSSTVDGGLSGRCYGISIRPVSE